MQVTDFNDLKAAVDLKAYADDVCEKDKNGKPCCPKCGSGTHKNRDSALKITADGKHVECFACDLKGTVIDLACAVNHTSDVKEGVRALAEWAHLEAPFLYGKTNTDKAKANQAASKPTVAKKTDPNTPSAEQAALNISSYLANARANLNDSRYPQGVGMFRARGFSDEEIAAFGFGYDPAKDTGVIPWPGDTYYAGRFVSPREDGRRYDNAAQKFAGKQPLFNPDALKSETVFLVEGLLDAYALMAAGFNNVVALATNNISEKSLEALTSSKYDGVVVIATDNDGAGEEGAELIKSKFDEAGILYIEGDAAPEGYKDAGEVFQEDREKLKAHYKALEDKAQADKAALMDAALARAGLANPAETAGDILLLSDTQELIPTGFARLDKALDGGLTAGLYVIGAASSLGKTTFVGQIADYIAAAGKPFLFVSIEQSAKELVSKSLTRVCRSVAAKVSDKPNPDGVYSSNRLMSERYRKTFFNEEQNAILLQACEEYSDTVAPCMKIYHPTKGRPSIADIEHRAQLMQHYYGAAPVIAIDYLQLVAAQDPHDTDKQTTDKNVTALRQLVSDLQTPVFVISSINRESYYMPIELESFKESGGIEYGADVVMGLQVRDFDDKLVSKPDKNGNTKPLYGEARKMKAKRIYNTVKTRSERELELLILKNRNGAMPARPLPFDFLPGSMLFSEPC